MKSFRTWSTASWLTACLFILMACAAPPDASRGATPTGSESYVLLDTSEAAYTILIAFPGSALEAVRSKIGSRTDVLLLTKSAFDQYPGRHLLPRILKNEYPQSRVVDGLQQLLTKFPGAEFGLTWNGGVAVTRNDFQHARRTHSAYQFNPAEYERTRIRDPRADPVRPESHFGPLLGR